MTRRKTPLLNVIGAAVKLARRNKGLTQTQLAELLHAHGWKAARSAIKKIERADRGVTDYELVALCRVLDTTPGDLLRDAPKKLDHIFASGR